VAQPNHNGTPSFYWQPSAALPRLMDTLANA